MSYTICYTSKAINNLSISEVESVFDATMSNNRVQGITGILLYSSGYFFQVLEGNQKEVKELFYETIYSDNRHFELFVVMEKFAEKSFFESYSTEFTVVKSRQDYYNLKGYIEANFVDSDSEKIKRLLAPFIHMNNAN